MYLYTVQILYVFNMFFFHLLFALFKSVLRTMPNDLYAYIYHGIYNSLHIWTIWCTLWIHIEMEVSMRLRYERYKCIGTHIRPKAEQSKVFDMIQLLRNIFLFVAELFHQKIHFFLHSLLTFDVQCIYILFSKPTHRHDIVGGIFDQDFRLKESFRLEFNGR